MRKIRSEKGSTLLLIIGIIAALATLGASLVVLTSNSMNSMGQERSKTKAFDVAESSLDRGMYKLGAKWPKTSTAPAVWTTADEASMRNLSAGGFPVEDYPDPRLADVKFSDVVFVDNQVPIVKTINYDKGGPQNTATAEDETNIPDEKMWVIATATTGTAQSRVRVLVQRTWLDIPLPRGVPLAAGGNLTNAGSNVKIQVEVAPPTGITTTIHIGGTIEDPDVIENTITQSSGEGPDNVADVFSPSLVSALKATAQANGRYFTSLAAAESSPVDVEWSPQGGISGLCVIEAGPTQNFKITGNDSINSEFYPGMLLILGGATLTWGGNADFYGAVYCEGEMSTAVGTATIHGMAVTTSHENMKGTPQIAYNDNCIAKLMNRFSLNVKMVTNTWRELNPKEPL